MGMAASQARLLTLTARLNHIELESQGVTNSKIRLSDKTQQASDEYIKALSKTELLYSTYNSQGEIVNQKLTGAALTTYGSLKNQYGIINSSGQIMVSELDGKNFKESNNLQEFLDKYGLMSEPGKGQIIQVENPAYGPAMDDYNEKVKKWQTEKPDPANPIYEIPGETTETSLYDSFLWANAICFGSAMSYLSKALGLPGGELLDSEGNLVVSYGPDGHKDYKDDKSGQIMYEEPIQSWSKECYSHVLDHLLVGGTYTTSTGQPFTSGSHWWGTGSYNDRGGRAAELAEIMKSTANPVLYACGDTGKDITPNSSDVEKLMSDYYFDENGEKKLKTLEQKMVDLNYANMSNTLSDQELYDSIMHFVEHDLETLNQSPPDFNDELYNKDLEEWESREPAKPDIPFYVDKEVRVITKKDEAQWYINLWHRMNGESDFKAGFGESDEYNSADGYASISKTNQSWCVLKDGDMNSPEWLKFALENGVVTLEQIQFANPSVEGTGVKDVKWTSIIWSSAQDISEQKNSTAATLAEVKYNNELKTIEAKDKQFDNRLKQLDTEHKAMQTEYDSIKTVIQKNTERTFKLFS